MPVNLNLLPPELSVSKSLNKLLKTIKALGVIGIVAFLIFAVGLGVFFVINTISLNSLKANIADLKSQVSSQQKSEQSMILLKDRIAKTMTVKNMPNSLKNLTNMWPFLTELSGSTVINQMTVSPTGVGLSVNLTTNSDLTKFIKAFQSSDVFRVVELTSFNLSPATGYSVEVNAEGK